MKRTNRFTQTRIQLPDLGGANSTALLTKILIGHLDPAPRPISGIKDAVSFLPSMTQPVAFSISSYILSFCKGLLFLTPF